MFLSHDWLLEESFIMVGSILQFAIDNRRESKQTTEWNRNMEEKYYNQ